MATQTGVDWVRRLRKGAGDPLVVDRCEAPALGGGHVEVVPVPHDCVDGFAHAWWRRPEAYLDPQVRAGISAIARLPEPVVDTAMARLAADLADGTWHHRHGHLLDETELDAGYRLALSPG